MYRYIGTLKWTVETNGAGGLELPTFIVIEPEGVPLRTAGRLLSIEITVPGCACTSNIAEEKVYPRLSSTTSPDDERELFGRIVTVPPASPW
jgi:hypothetical protein